MTNDRKVGNYTIVINKFVIFGNDIKKLFFFLLSVVAYYDIYLIFVLDLIAVM